MRHPTDRRQQTQKRGHAAKPDPAESTAADQPDERESFLDAMYRRIDEDLINR